MPIEAFYVQTVPSPNSNLTKSIIDPVARNYFDNPYTEILHKSPHQQCVRCVMDTSDPWISFDTNGVCSHCQAYSAYAAQIGTPEERARQMDKMVTHLKEQGKGKSYDCIMGLSGGVDSSYLAWYAVKKLGLRPLVVHVDAGWNSELAISNIQNIVERLGIDLHTLVIDWPEMRDLQRSYFLSGVANLDVPQDHAFIAALSKEARKYGLRDVLNGGNMQTESILPNAWGYDASDATSLLGIHKQFGTVPLKTYPIYSNWQRMVYYPFILKLRSHRPLELLDYNKEQAKDLLKSELGWRDYGGKHYESTFTKFFQAHYLPEKFGYDKRLAHLSSLIVSGQMSREEALDELNAPLYDPKELSEDTLYWTKKIGITKEEYDRVMIAQPRDYTDYPNSEKFYDWIRSNLRPAVRMYQRARSFGAT